MPLDLATLICDGGQSYKLSFSIISLCHDSQFLTAFKMLFSSRVCEMEMETEDAETLLERIWDLHDKLSDAIHSISRSQFLCSVKTLRKIDERTKTNGVVTEDDHSAGFVFMKDFRLNDEEAVEEARSLNAIRSALENLEDQLEFFHTVQSQQQTERDSAIARLEQSRITLAKRLADHHGKRYKVIEESLAFVGDVHQTAHFISPEILLERSRGHKDNHTGQMSSAFVNFLISSACYVKKSFKLARMCGIFGNATLFAVSMLALFQLHRINFKNGLVFELPNMQGETYYRRKSEKNVSVSEVSFPNTRGNQLDVLWARG